ncbi:hypothetical protein F0224_06510 [Vibrio coralliilyticus]|uniref:hypothetical protein n=1 Tax=Vibrio coralliilyticus TaxID=190893 RepID=UPI000BAC1527|nr:hypothetical protein [Vibrio coralliilyticus]NOI75324.1 hypothetical protein [Vibrio coralliilyticus]PAW04156.1 hypothetical protein CKJ79_05320 [Vibrio coralliilyticus]
MLTQNEKEERQFLLEVSKLRIEYSRHASTLYMAVLGGQITLFGTVFKGNDNTDIKYMVLSIIFMLFSCIAVSSFSESALRRIHIELLDDKEKKKQKSKWINSGYFEAFKSYAGAIAFILSIICYLTFSLNQPNVLTMFEYITKH